MFESFIFDQIYQGNTTIEETDMSPERYNELLAEHNAAIEADVEAWAEKQRQKEPVVISWPTELPEC